MDGLREYRHDRSLQRCPAGEPNGICNVLIGVETRAAATFREKFERGRVESFVYIDGISLGLVRVAVNATVSFAFFRRKPDDIFIVANPAKTVALPPKGRATSTEEVSLSGSIDAHTVKEGEVTVVGIPSGVEDYMLERAMEVTKDGCADRFARCLTHTPDIPAATLVTIDDRVPRAAGKIARKVSDHGAVSMQQGRQQGAMSVRGNL